MSQYLSGANVEDFEYYIEKHQRKKERKERKHTPQQSGLKIEEIEPLTYTQRLVFESYNAGNQLVLHGCAGTGKTFLSLYLAVRDVLEKVDGKQKVIIVRSVVPTRDMGFLPGNITEKTKVYEAPYRDLMSGMFDRGDAYEILKQRGKIDFITTSFIRGQTWDDSIIVVDEYTNMTFQELDSVITRVGENSRLILSGDYEQSDLQREYEKSGAKSFRKIVDKMDEFDTLEFGLGDIVRSGICRSYLTQKHILYSS